MTEESKYSADTDENLIQRFHAGEEEIMEYLLDKYKYLVRKVARKLFLIGGEPDDILQEGMIGLFKAIRDYKPEKESSFCTFAELCISRHIYNAITASNRKKHAPLRDYISLSSVNDEDDPEQTFTADNSNFFSVKSPEELVLDKEAQSMVEYEIERCLSTFEKQVLQMYLSGVGYVEIAKELNRSPKSTDNAIQRIRAKLKRLRS